MRAANENLAEFRLLQSTVACQNPFPVLCKLGLKYQNHFYISWNSNLLRLLNGIILSGVHPSLHLIPWYNKKSISAPLRSTTWIGQTIRFILPVSAEHRRKNNTLWPSSHFFSPFSVVLPTQIFGIFKKKKNDVVKPFFTWNNSFNLKNEHSTSKEKNRNFFLPYIVHFVNPNMWMLTFGVRYQSLLFLGFL